MNHPTEPQSEPKRRRPETPRSSSDDAAVRPKTPDQDDDALDATLDAFLRSFLTGGLSKVCRLAKRSSLVSCVTEARRRNFGGFFSFQGI